MHYIIMNFENDHNDEPILNAFSIALPSRIIRTLPDQTRDQTQMLLSTPNFPHHPPTQMTLQMTT